MGTKKKTQMGQGVMVKQDAPIEIERRWKECGENQICMGCAQTVPISTRRYSRTGCQ